MLKQFKRPLPTTCDLMTFELAQHVAKRVTRQTADGLEVRQVMEPRNDGVDAKLQRIWAIFDKRRDEWLEVFVDPDNVPL